MKIGICNKCGKQVTNDDPRVGYFCGEQLYREATLKDGTTTRHYFKCDGIIVRHEVTDNNPS